MSRSRLHQAFIKITMALLFLQCFASVLNTKIYTFTEGAIYNQYDNSPLYEGESDEGKMDFVDYLRPRKNFVEQAGNNCPENDPWPCKTPNRCLAFDFICDGSEDCPDGYDEDPNLCTAKDRPAFDILLEFISRYRSWLIPDYLGDGRPSHLALKLIESKTVDEYASSVDMTEKQKENLKFLLEAVENGRQMQLLLMGMPPSAWEELIALFRRIIMTGFFKD